MKIYAVAIAAFALTACIPAKASVCANTESILRDILIRDRSTYRYHVSQEDRADIAKLQHRLLTFRNAASDIPTANGAICSVDVMVNETIEPELQWFFRVFPAIMRVTYTVQNLRDGRYMVEITSRQ
jgi:hypothetical protein